MAYSVGLPATPEWWLNRFVTRLLDRQQRYDVLEAYFYGNHSLPDGDERYVKALRSLQQKARTNYYGMATKSPVERMNTKFFRIAGKPDEDAARVWSGNNMDYQAPLLYLSSAVLGDSYIMVSPPDPTNIFAPDIPIITIEDPRTTISEEDPARPLMTRAALRMWQDDVLGKVVAVLYTPTRQYTYVGPSTSDISHLDKPGLTKRLLAGTAGGGLELVSDEPNPLGLVPIVRAAWQPTFGGTSLAECEDALDVQDRINSTILDRMVISRAQAYKQRWAKGIKLPKSKSGQVKPPFDPGADMLWVTEDPDAEFGEFSETDIRMILEAVRDDVMDFASITKTPAHYLMGKMANVSGSTITQSEAGHTSKTRQRMKAVGWAQEQFMRLAFLYMGNEKATEIDFEVVWDDPELHSRVDLADAFSKETAGGLPVTMAGERLGLDADQLVELEEFQAEQLAREEQARADDMAMQEKALAAKTSPGASPGGAK